MQNKVYIKVKLKCYCDFLLGMIEAENITWALEQPYIEDSEHVCVQQLLQERQQFEAWRASQAQPQPQPPISSSGHPFKVGDDVVISAGRSRGRCCY